MGSNPTPSSFLASDTPISVTLGAGLYEVIEERFDPDFQQCLSRGFDGGRETFPGHEVIICTDFSEDCSGDISAGESLSCNINNVVINTAPATLTVKKQVFGCLLFPATTVMDCDSETPNSSQWHNCNENIPVLFNTFCQSLPEDSFDIEVSDDQENQIQQFKGSEQGTLIQNLNHGNYTVNEIKNATSFTNQLGVNADAEQNCINTGFPDGGRLDNTTSPVIQYHIICFEYEDEQGNDCSNITLAAGESRTCTVKNYIQFAID
jgi:hypothetical protein